ncbi:MAG: hypothetical protein LOY58_08020 [Gammaproteobacteria bacterium]|nr:hypothetical protein [Gammaproteobacteria bacterium]
MADHDWPTSLPHFLVEGYARGGGEDGVIRSEFPGGVKMRPRFTTAPPEPVQGVVLCDKAQLQTLLDFYNITLRRVLRFNHVDHTKPDTTPVEYRFTGRPSYEPAGSGFLYRVTLPLEQMTTYQGTYPLDIEGIST